MESEILNFKFLAFRKLGITVKRIISRKNFINYFKTFDKYKDYWIDDLIIPSYEIIDFHIKYNSCPYTKYFNIMMPCPFLLMEYIIDKMYVDDEIAEIEECIKTLLKMGRIKIHKHISFRYHTFTAIMHCEKSTIRELLGNFEMDYHQMESALSTLVGGKKDDLVIKLYECINMDREIFIEHLRIACEKYNCPKRFQKMKEKLLN